MKQIFFAKYAIAPPILVHKIGATGPDDIYNAFDISYEAAVYAYKYYLKWKGHYQMIGRLTTYERETVRLFRHNLRRKSIEGNRNYA